MTQSDQRDSEVVRRLDALADVIDLMRRVALWGIPMTLIGYLLAENAWLRGLVYGKDNRYGERDGTL